MLENIRKAANHFIFKFFSFIIVLAFISWGISDIFRNKSDSILVKFKDQRPISMSEFLLAKQERIKYIQSVVKPPLTEDQLKSMNIDEIVLEGLINDRVFGHLSSYYDLYFSDENVINKIKTLPAFLNKDGKFDYALFHNTLRRNGTSESEYLNRMKQDLSSQITINIFSHEKLTPRSLSEQIAKYLNQQRIFDFISVDPLQHISFKNSKIDEAKLQEIYEKNKDQFITEEKRDIEYVEISPDVIKIEISEAEINKYYSENKSEYKNPAIFSFYDIVIGNKDDADKIAEAIKNNHHESFVKEKTGKDFISYLRQNISEDELNKEIAAMLKSQDDISIVKDGSKYHVIKKELHIPARSISLKDARQDIESILRQEKFDVAFTNLTREIDDAIGDSLSLKEVAKKFSLAFKARNKIEKSDKDNITAKAFELREGEISEIFEVDSGSSAILCVAKIYPSRSLEFSEVRAEILKNLQRELAFKEATDKLTLIGKNINLSNISEVALNAGFHTSTNNKITRAMVNAGKIGDYPEKLVAELFALNKEQVTSICSSGDKLYLAIVRDSAYSNDIDPAAISAHISKSYQSSIMDEVMIFLRRESKVQIIK